MTYPQLPPRLGLNGRPEGIDWDAVRAQREATLDDQVARGVDDWETKAHAAQKTGQIAPEKPKPKPVATRAGVGGGKPSYDRKQIVSMYVDERMTVDDIANTTGAHRQTVRNNLKAAKVKLRDDRIGNPRGRMGRR